MIYVVAQLRLKPGMTERACAEARKVVAGTVQEDGAKLAGQHDAAAMAFVRIEHDAVDGRRGAPASGRLDLGRALHRCPIGPIGPASSWPGLSRPSTSTSFLRS